MNAVMLFVLALANAFWGGLRLYEMVHGNLNGAGWAGCIALNFFLAAFLAALALTEGR